jgi:hypothetical protein
VTQATNLPEAQPKIIFNIRVDHLTLSMAIVIFYPCPAFWKSHEHWEPNQIEYDNSNKTSPSKIVGRNWTF